MLDLFGIPIHKLIIHFPIALAIVALLYDGWAVWSKKPALHRTGYGLTIWAAVAALAAAGTGLQLSEIIHVNKGAVTGHAGFALTATILLAALAGLRYSAQAQEKKEFQVWWLVIEVAAAAFVSAAAITGHQL
jgi:uncharacterized membrane protein